MHYRPPGKIFTPRQVQYSRPYNLKTLIAWIWSRDADEYESQGLELGWIPPRTFLDCSIFWSFFILICVLRSSMSLLVWLCTRLGRLLPIQRGSLPFWLLNARKSERAQRSPTNCGRHSASQRTHTEPISIPLGTHQHSTIHRQGYCNQDMRGNSFGGRMQVKGCLVLLACGRRRHGPPHLWNRKIKRVYKSISMARMKTTSTARCNKPKGKTTSKGLVRLKTR